MFAYDAQIAAAVRTPAQTIADVLEAMRAIDGICAGDADGLKWFNWLYLQVTEAVKARIDAGDFSDAAWMAELDVEFANLYFGALCGYLTQDNCPDCWRALFSVRSDARIARIQFAMAGVNAHINHDLPEAIVATCASGNTALKRDCAKYRDYTSLNATLDSMIDMAETELMVRLPGDPLPAVNHLEYALAAWGTAAAREQAWNNSEALWQLRSVPAIRDGFLETLDGLASFAGRTLLAPVP
jgi:Family of unknown function (DUF5995)